MMNNLYKICLRKYKIKIFLLRLGFTINNWVSRAYYDLLCKFIIIILGYKQQ